MRPSQRIVVALALAAISLVSSRARGQCPAAIAKLLADGKLDAPRTEADVLLKRNANDDNAIQSVGRSLERQGNSGEAVDWLEKAVKINSNNASHHLYLA